MYSEDDPQKRVLYELIQERAFVRGDQKTIVFSEARNSPWMFDLRAVFLEPDIQMRIAEHFWEHVWPSNKPVQIAGMETAAIPLITTLVLIGHQKGKDVSGFYIRKSRKKYGLCKQLEGEVRNDVPVVLVDDLINTGGSLMRQAELLRQEGLAVSTAFFIVRYRPLEAYTQCMQHNVIVNSLFTLADFGLPNEELDAPKCQLTFTQRFYFKSTNASYALVLPKPAPCVLGTQLIFCCDNGFVWKLDQYTGSVLWKQKLGFFTRQHVLASPLIHDDKIYLTTYTGLLYVLSLHNGRVLYHRSFASRSVVAPVLLDTTLVVCGEEQGKGVIAGFSLGDYKQRWEYHTDAPLCGSMSVKLGHFTAMDTSGTLYRGGEDGVTKSAVRARADIETQGHLTFDMTSEQYFWADAAGRIFRTEKNLKHHTLICTCDASVATPLVVAGALLVASSLDGSVYCVEWKTGTLAWRFETRGRVMATPVIHDGTVYVGSNDATLYALKLETGQRLGVHYVTERITSPVVHADDTLYVTTFANELYALGVTKEDANESSKDQ